MKHLEDISRLLLTLQKSTCFHALVIQSPSGWGKSTAIERVLREQNIVHHCIGSYSTPLGLYNCLVDNFETTIVIDDAAGLFGDPIALAILKAATWPSSGTNGNREIRWNSTHEKVKAPVMVFKGKIIVITNSLPSTVGIDSFLSRTLYLRIQFNSEEIAEMLRDAAQRQEFFTDTSLAKDVAEFLVANISNSFSASHLSLRTLAMGYEMARANPNDWRELLSKLAISSPRDAVAKTKGCETPSKVGDQVRDFVRMTGMSRRTFFNYRKSYKEGSRR